MDSYDPKLKQLDPYINNETMGIALVAVLAIVFCALFFTSGSAKREAITASSIFEFSVESITGEPVSLSKFKGKKAYLLVNVASK
mmetsp:Transcript_7923/g.13132  ORF Transcript_7923/g.13132 Transcript_7923/m.13132 type:complete len:85 (-) Transcript_7923:762-1016(-)